MRTRNYLAQPRYPLNPFRLGPASPRKYAAKSCRTLTKQCLPSSSASSGSPASSASFAAVLTGGIIIRPCAWEGGGVCLHNLYVFNDFALRQQFLMIFRWQQCILHCSFHNICRYGIYMCMSIIKIATHTSRMVESDLAFVAAYLI